ncbi:hypothetical protein BELL_0964g00020 [Botrytis elliptica]|uniref:Uncharacterized protein n=1 Tax=Botrytis elliptica TaxID=278938 RepID=A0A4Z1J470_9HELO|nr:hypothetical protein BELL_0964g00020 [Botrytis elliptica]
MEFSLEIKRPTVNFGTLNKDRQPPKLITFQSTFLKNDQEEIHTTKASETVIFEKLPLIQVLFDSKLNGTLKDDKDQICYDPEHARTERPAFPKISGKIVYMYNLIQSSLKNRGREYEQIVKWNTGTLWTMIDCLVRFLDGKPLPLDSKMGLMEKHWDLELIGIEVLAMYLGCTEIDKKTVRNALISYMRRLPTSEFANSSSSLEKTSEITNRAKMLNRNNSGQAEIIDLTEEDQISAPKTIKEKSRLAPKSQKLNAGQLASIPKSLGTEPPPGSTLKKSIQAAQLKLNPRKSNNGNQPAANLHNSRSSIQSNQISKEQKKAKQSTPTLRRSNEKLHQITTSRTPIEATRSKFSRLGPQSMPIDAYISLNETYGCFLHVHIGSATKGSGLIGRLLQDLHMGFFNTGEMSKVVGKGRNGKPMLVWDEVLKYFSVPGNVVENMLSWSEDDRWTPMVMFIERCQLDRTLWQDWDERDLALANYFDMFVKATPGAKDV